MTINSVIGTVRMDLRHFGVARTLYDVFVRLLNQLVFFKVLKVISAPKITLKDRLPKGFLFREMSLDEFRAFSKDPEYEIGPILIEELCRNGNKCFGLFDSDGALANYVLMYVSSAHMNKDLEVSFDEGYAYLCMTFTHPRYRGLHLSSVGVGLAAQRFLDMGYGLLAYVESHNFSSLRSLSRIGWREVGSVFVVRCLGRYFIHATSGCKPYGFRLMPTSANRPPLLDVDAA
jgi:hypothetical protein